MRFIYFRLRHAAVKQRWLIKRKGYSIQLARAMSLARAADVSLLPTTQVIREYSYRRDKKDNKTPADVPVRYAGIPLEDAGDKVYTGSCLHGGIQFRGNSERAPIQACHCQQCRTAQGAPFTTNSPIWREAFGLLRGSDLLALYESLPGKRRLLCRRCGSPVYSSRDSLPGVLRVRVGLINESVLATPVAHAFVASKCNWWAGSDALPQFPEAYVEPKLPVT